MFPSQQISQLITLLVFQKRFWIKGYNSPSSGTVISELFCMLFVVNIWDKTLWSNYLTRLYPNPTQKSLRQSKVCSDPTQTSKMELFEKIVNNFAKNSILDIWMVSECLYQYLFHSILQNFNNFIKTSKNAFTWGIANILDEPFLY